ncbi:MAG: guanylate kinase [Clostridia bacterium]|nr:guanylate kinase [Clostridia bacterium]
MKNDKGMLIVVSGFSGVGKGTVAKLVFESLPELKFSVSCTTRAPREGEIDGVNYYFLSEEEFERRISADEFAEYTRTFTNYYGTLKSEIDRAISVGDDVMLELNVVGARNIKKLYPDSVTIFIAPPSIEELKHRLIGRGTESEDSLKRRFDEIDLEKREIEHYDYCVTNNVVRDCADEIVGIIKSEHLKVSRKNIENLIK